jgi:hypothetical protein
MLLKRPVGSGAVSAVRLPRCRTRCLPHPSRVPLPTNKLPNRPPNRQPTAHRFETAFLEDGSAIKRPVVRIDGPGEGRAFTASPPHWFFPHIQHSATPTMLRSFVRRPPALLPPAPSCRVPGPRPPPTQPPPVPAPAPPHAGHPAPLLFTRIWPEQRETSMVLRPRPYWDDMRAVLAGEGEAGPDGRPKLRCGKDGVASRTGRATAAHGARVMLMLMQAARDGCGYVTVGGCAAQVRRVRVHGGGAAVRARGVASAGHAWRRHPAGTTAVVRQP